MPRATTAAWEVMPPRVVRIPFAALMPAMSSGLVSARTRTIGSPLAASSMASFAEKATRPQAAPGTGREPPRQQPLLPDRLRLRRRLEDRREDLDQLLRLNPLERLAGREGPLVDHVDGDLHRGEAGPFSAPGLEQVERVPPGS